MTHGKSQHPTPNTQSLKLATRQSPLALAQADIVAGALAPRAVEILPMLTSGDRFAGQPLAEIGGKGLFTKEIEEALLDGRADIAVHSCKDMPTRLPDGLIIGAYLPREDARDCLILSPLPEGGREGFLDAAHLRKPGGGAHAQTPAQAAPPPQPSPPRGEGVLAALPQNAIIGTSSLRRGVQLQRARPDIKIVPLRGNVQTRIRKIEEGQAHATLLAMAGLKRLKLDPLPGTPLSIDEMLPAVAQGIIAIECREDDTHVRDMLSAIDHTPTRIAAECERTVLAALDGSCRTPIAAYTEVNGNTLRLRAFAARPDGSNAAGADETADVKDAVKLGEEIGARLKSALFPLHA